MRQTAGTCSGSLARTLAKNITDSGFAVVENFVQPTDLRHAQDFVSEAITANGGEYTSFSGTDDLADTFLARLPRDPAFVDLCREIYRHGTDTAAPDVGFYQILRCLSGAGAREHSLRFHFDSYVLTALIPITMPNHGSPGRLLIHPNTRAIRRTYLANVMDKVLCDNALSQKLLNAAYRRGTKRLVRIELTPGNLYFFWGYRSLHTNEPCEADAIRATALLHYADPHAESWLKRRRQPH